MYQREARYMVIVPTIVLVQQRCTCTCARYMSRYVFSVPGTIIVPGTTKLYLYVYLGVPWLASYQIFKESSVKPTPTVSQQSLTWIKAGTPAAAASGVGGPAPGAKASALGSPNLTALFALNEQISTKFKINKKQINLSFRANNKYIYCGVRPI